VGRPGGEGFQVKIRDPFHPDTMPDWLKISRAQFPQLEQAIYDFADRHQHHVMEKHERKGNNQRFVPTSLIVMVASSKLLFRLHAAWAFGAASGHFPIEGYLDIFTGTLPQYRDEVATGYLAKIYTNRQGEPKTL